jgi:hypothetical protein
MRQHLDIYVPALFGTALTLALWYWLSRRLGERGLTRWRALPLCLPLLLMTVGYGLFWFGFFQSPALAVQLHAVRLTINHVTDGFVSYAVFAWVAACVVLLMPLLKPRQTG